jgi:hypothetical protein
MNNTSNYNFNYQNNINTQNDLSNQNNFIGKKHKPFFSNNYTNSNLIMSYSNSNSIDLTQTENNNDNFCNYDYNNEFLPKLINRNNSNSSKKNILDSINNFNNLKAELMNSNNFNKSQGGVYNNNSSWSKTHPLSSTPQFGTNFQIDENSNLFVNFKSHSELSSQHIYYSEISTDPYLEKIKSFKIKIKTSETEFIFQIDHSTIENAQIHSKIKSQKFVKTFYFFLSQVPKISKKIEKKGTLEDEFPYPLNFKKNLDKFDFTNKYQHSRNEHLNIAGKKIIENLSVEHFSNINMEGGMNNRDNFYPDQFDEDNKYFFNMLNRNDCKSIFRADSVLSQENEFLNFYLLNLIIKIELNFTSEEEYNQFLEIFCLSKIISQYTEIKKSGREKNETLKLTNYFINRKRSFNEDNGENSQNTQKKLNIENLIIKSSINTLLKSSKKFEDKIQHILSDYSSKFYTSLLNLPFVLQYSILSLITIKRINIFQFPFDFLDYLKTKNLAEQTFCSLIIEKIMDEYILLNENECTDFLEIFKKFEKKFSIPKYDKNEEYVNSQNYMVSTEDLLSGDNYFNLDNMDFMKTRTLEVSPNLIFYKPPIYEKQNALLRHFPEYQENFIKVNFVDEEGDKIFGSSKSKWLLIYFQKKVMLNGIAIGSRIYEFLSASNSQMKNSSYWFFCLEGTRYNQIEDLIRELGDFSLESNVCKNAARRGQCLSTTNFIKHLQKENIVIIPDITRNNFIFTDGIGKISKGLAKIICEKMKMEYASAFQIRIGGVKGILSIDPSINENEQIQVRPSMTKYESNDLQLGVVRCSSYSQGYLNRQFITLLKSLGVSEEIFINMMQDEKRKYTNLSEAYLCEFYEEYMQGAYYFTTVIGFYLKKLRKVYKNKIANEIEEIVNSENLDEKTLSNKNTNNKNKEIISLDEIIILDDDGENQNNYENSKNSEKCENLSSPMKIPFIANLLQNQAAAKLIDLKSKGRILNKPSAFLIGVIDETETLNEGEVFVQISHWLKSEENGGKYLNLDDLQSHSQSYDESSEEELEKDKDSNISQGQGHEITNNINTNFSSSSSFNINEQDKNKDKECLSQSTQSNTSSKKSKSSTHNNYYILDNIPVFVTKNPCLHPGDIKILTAVKNQKCLQNLSHHVNVIVFSSKGFRPIQNQISGGDLDGDIYYISWNEEILNEIKIRNFPSQEETKDLHSIENINSLSQCIKIKDIINSYIDLARNDTVGLISNAHMAFADKDLTLGAFNQKCLDLSQLFSIAIDASKSGIFIPLEELKNKNLLINFEQPDFLETPGMKEYKSPGILGKLYRSINYELNESVENFDKIEYEYSYLQNYEIEYKFFTKNCIPYLEKAFEIYLQYQTDIKNLIILYKVTSETEFFLIQDIHIKKNNKKLKQKDLFDHIGNLRDKYTRLIYSIIEGEKIHTTKNKNFISKNNFSFKDVACAVYVASHVNNKTLNRRKEEILPLIEFINSGPGTMMRYYLEKHFLMKKKNEENFLKFIRNNQDGKKIVKIINKKKVFSLPWLIKEVREELFKISRENDETK